MSRVNKRIYELITNPDRFRAAAEIADQMEDIELELWNDFMNQVNIYLQSNIPKDWNVWPLGGDTMFIDDRDQLGIYNNYYKVEGYKDAIFWILFDEDVNNFGLWFNTLYTQLDSSLMKKDIDDLIKKGWKKGSSWGKDLGEFIVYKKAEESFIDAVDYEIILPANRDELVKKYGRYLLDSIKDLDAKAKKWFDTSKISKNLKNK